MLRNLFYLLCGLGFLLLVATYMYARKLEHDYQLSDRSLTGALWEMPARVYARPLELYVGKTLAIDDLLFELDLLGYSKTHDPTVPKTYARQENRVIYYAEAFAFGEAFVPARRIEVSFEQGKISKMVNSSDFSEPSFERLNPLLIASIYPKHLQDRLLVKLDEVPPLLIETLIALEDKRFWTHMGFDIKGIARAVYVSLISKSGQQGASTLTQQFVKNHYLTNERTISRKIKEILMAIVIEMHNDKAQILEGYLNEIYLGQDGKHAIHGFGLASRYYFDKNLADINLHEIALLVALVREPGSADPHKHPKYALARRNFIIEQMVANGLISAELGEMAQSLPLDVLPKGQTSNRTRFPAFMDLVQQQLNQHYSREDLTNEGLNIFTTLDPIIQHKMQQQLDKTLRSLEGNKARPQGFLQSASVLVDIASGGVVALIGGRDADKEEIHGFNRAISAQRQAGSVIKPAIYLSALEYPNRYTTASLLDDSPLNYQGWKPKNYGRNNRGWVNLQDALVKSYNIPTARLAIDLGMDDIIPSLERLGAREGLPPYPSLALGAIGMTPFEVAQIYETFANNGTFTALRSIRQISTPSGKILPPHEKESYQAIFPGPHYLIVSTMQEIPKRGTASKMPKALKALNVAGKTGTTDNYRDSWFAGFTGNYLNVVWVGNDDNQPTGLSGGNGALPVWSAMMSELNHEKLELNVPPEIEFHNIDTSTGNLAGQYCTGRHLPFLAGSQPYQVSECAPSEEEYYDSWGLESYTPAPAPYYPEPSPVGTYTPIGYPPFGY